MIAEKTTYVCRSHEVMFDDIPEKLQPGVGERWFVAQTLSNRENIATSNLERLGFRTFAPRFWRTVRHARKSRNVLAPIFPSYAFVILNLDRDRWRSINGTVGVASLLMAAELPMAVPRGVVEALISRRGSVGPIGFHQDLKIGQTCRILSGPFAETLCQLDHLDDRGRVRVLLEIMGGKVPAHLDRSVLGPAA